MDDQQFRSELEAMITKLGHHERRALLVLARRIFFGQRTHGLLNPRDGRNFIRERGEELQDLLIYTAYAELARLETGDDLVEEQAAQ